MGIGGDLNEGAHVDLIRQNALEISTSRPVIDF